jgi:hypothetical protein
MVEVIFKTPLKDYNVIITLKHDVVPNYNTQNVTKVLSNTAKKIKMDKTDYKNIQSLPPILNPVLSYVQELEVIIFG